MIKQWMLLHNIIHYYKTLRCGLKKKSSLVETIVGWVMEPLLWKHNFINYMVLTKFSFSTHHMQP